MLKNILSSLSKGIFYTIGRILAYILIGFLIGFLLMKFDISNFEPSQLIMFYNFF